MRMRVIDSSDEDSSAQGELTVRDDADDDMSEYSSDKSSEASSSETSSTAIASPRRERKPKTAAYAHERVHYAPQEYIPRRRKNELSEEREAIEKAHVSTSNRLQPFEPREFKSWDEFDAAFATYCSENNVRYSLRNSRTVSYANKNRRTDFIPRRFSISQRDYYCIHGRIQKTRGSGQREHRRLYNGCLARLSVVVRQICESKCPGDDHWRIIIKNETFTHNHISGKEVSDSYFRASDLDQNEDKAVLEQVGQMIDMNSSFKHIKQYLALELDKNISSQQARNVIAVVEGKNSSQDRLKTLLNDFGSVDGNDVLIAQDQMNITTIIALQSSLQKECFRDWGDTLVMDWTHNTNNLGYHHGSLLVTSPTGRGIPIIDFLALNEQANTMRCILEFFKTKNPSWSSVKTVIIDKDFVEWAILEECFPAAKILLCQYHAITYWRKLLRRRSYSLTPLQREDIESLFIRLVYSSDRPDFDEAYEYFSEYCRQINPKVLSYFQKNWLPCVDMWSNYARGIYFTAGNTTTNRIEAHWNQLKQLIGQKPRFDKTVVGILTHQLAVFHQFTTVVRQHTTRSRNPESVPLFLQRVAAIASDFVLQRLRQQYDSMEVFFDDAKITKYDTSGWVVVASKHKYICDDLMWECSCIFQTTHKLPCRHLMYIAKTVHKMEKLPMASIPDRWSMKAATKFLDIVENASKILTPILSRKSTAPGANPPCQAATLLNDSATLTDDSAMRSTLLDKEMPAIVPKAQQRKAYVHVRLRREERARMVVLSEAEKYNLARTTLEPLLEHLSSMSSANFFRHLRTWEKLVSAGVGLAKSSSPPQDVGPQNIVGETDEDKSSENWSSSEGSMPDIIDFLEAAEVVLNAPQDSELRPAVRWPQFPPFAEREVNDLPTDLHPSQVSLFDFDISEQSQDIIERQTDLQSQSAQKKRPLPEDSDPPNGEIDDSGSEQDTSSQSELAQQLQLGRKSSESLREDIQALKLPPGRRDTTRQTPSKRRKAIVHMIEPSSVVVSKVVMWAQETGNLRRVFDVLNAYPVGMVDKFLELRSVRCSDKPEVEGSACEYGFVIPPTLVNKMYSAIKVHNSTRRTSRTSTQASKQPEEGLPTSNVLVVSISGATELGYFSQECVFAMHRFHTIKNVCNNWVEDLKWLERDWTKLSSVSVELFSEHVRRMTPQDIANSVIEKFKTASLKSAFSATACSAPTFFEEVVGYVARAKMLNDTIIDKCCEAIADDVDGCVVYSSHTCDVGFNTFPMINRTEGIVLTLDRVEFVVIPVHLPLHWAVIIVERQDAAWLIRIYEPMCLDEYKEHLKNICNTHVIPFLKKWHDKSEEQTGVVSSPFPPVNFETMTTPQQPGGTSCGVYVIGQVYSTVRRLPNYALAPSLHQGYISIMRLRIMWKLLCASHREDPTRDPSLDAVEKDLISMLSTAL